MSLPKLKNILNRLANVESAKLDKMVVSKSLNTAGWYRVAKYGDNVNLGKNIIINISTRKGYQNNMSGTFIISFAENKAKITSASSLINVSVINKIRIVKENNEFYIEIYYNYNQTNGVFIEILETRISNNSYLSMLDFEAPTDTATVLDELPIEEMIVTNSNGTAIKYPDGTMICRHVVVGNSFNCSQSSRTDSFYYQDTNNSTENIKTWIFPQEFISTDDLVVNLSVRSSAYTMSSIGSLYKSYVNGYCVLPYPVSNITFYWHFIAIGRWK